MGPGWCIIDVLMRHSVQQQHRCCACCCCKGWARAYVGLLCKLQAARVEFWAPQAHVAIANPFHPEPVMEQCL